MKETDCSFSPIKLLKKRKEKTCNNNPLGKNESESDLSQNISTSELRKEIAVAIKIQRKRGKRNSRLSPSEIKEFCKMDLDAKKILDEATETYEFSPRSVSSCIKIARTISDMKEENIIGKEAMEEAVKFKKPAGAMSLLA